MGHYDSRESAENYHRIFTEQESTRESRREAIERHRKFISRLKPGGHILDAGCGTGRFVHYFVLDGFKVTGIDNSNSMIQIAAGNNPEAVFRIMDMRQLDFQPDSFDGIWNVATMLHFDESEVEHILDEFKRVLRSDGTLFLATRAMEKNLKTIEESTEGGKMMVYYYTPQKLLEMLTHSGFETIELKVEPDDYSRPFNYAYALAKPAV
jgi:SAM-dependent methyltransferase